MAKQLNVTVVSDTLYWLETADLFKKLDCIVTLEHSPEAALKRLQRSTCDVLFLADVTPDTARIFLHELRDRGNRMPVAVFSTRAFSIGGSDRQKLSPVCVLPVPAAARDIRYVLSYVR